jgi:HAD superfamily hydrolase (TIGR01509 family)
LHLTGFFDIVVAKEHVTRHKPDPECYLLALERLSLPASEVLVLEDSNSGLLAAHHAHCDSVAFRHEFNQSHDFGLAIREISDFRELLETV